MSEQTKIAWCDSTVNFWEGCTKVSAGCANCYAEARDKRFTGGKLWGKGSPRRKSKSAVKDAFKYNRQPWICDVCGGASDRHYDHSCTGKTEDACHTDNVTWHRRRIFSLSLGDWLDDEVPIEWLAEMLDTIRQCDQVTWILCTKRPENFRERVNLACDYAKHVANIQLQGWLVLWLRGLHVPTNIILLASVENQAAADQRIPELLQIPVACRGLSIEPLLGPVDLEPSLALWKPRAFVLSPRNYINWLIIGGESGANARPCNIDWIRDIVRQGKAAGVPVFVKQLGANPVYTAVGISPRGDDFFLKKHWNDPKWNIPWNSLHNQAPKITDKKGGDITEWVEYLRVREFPKL